MWFCYRLLIKIKCTDQYNVHQEAMRKKSDTQQKIIDTARDLFHQRGVHATGIDKILQKSNAVSAHLKML